MSSDIHSTEGISKPVGEITKPGITLPVEKPLPERTGESFETKQGQSKLNSFSQVSSEAEKVRRFAEAAIGFNVCRKMDENEKKRKKRKKEIEAS